jgi:MraZ protein
MAFSGTFDYTLDAKNRLTVPAKFRTSLTDAVVLAKGTEQCMTIWPKRDFEAFVTGTLEGLHPLHPKRDALKRFFFSNSFDTELDSAGRVMVPPSLMQHAGLTKDVVVNGMDDRIEVWDREAWARYNAELDITALAADVAFGAPVHAGGPSA